MLQHAQCWMDVFRERVEMHTERGRMDAERAIARHVIDPDAPVDGVAATLLDQVRSPHHRAMLAEAVRRNMRLGMARARLAPPVARLLAQDADQAARIAAGLEAPDPDPRAVIETERQLRAGVPSAERLAWIARVLDVSRSPQAC